MNREQTSTTEKCSTLPQIRWLLKPSMEVEAAARWIRCRKDPSRESGDPRGDGPKSKPCYLCADYKIPAQPKEECWRDTFRELQSLLDDILARTFPDKSTVTVIDWLGGFTSLYDRPSLRVEVTGGDPALGVPQACIVKVALAGKVAPKINAERAREVSKRLEKEFEGYRHLADHGKGKAGPVFATLERGCEDKGGLQSLKYSDAEQTLRAGDTVVTLERAVLDACKGSGRSLDSIEATIVQLFAELEEAWYRHAWAAPVTDAGYLKDRLARGLGNWLKSQPDACSARDEVLWALRGRDVEFVDPALYFNPASWPKMPEMLVGTAHGDLHGRNVLVGIVEGEARWPVIFDYEDVTCCNLVAWDFVKLETELKKIALSDPAFLSAGNDADLIQQLYMFELRLNRQTEKCYKHNNWRRPLRDKDTPRSRLAHVILTIRRMAWKCLEFQRRRSRKWLHEYYFLLAAYGVYSARFPVFREVRPLKALFIGAGMAAYRYAYGEDLGRHRVALREVDALDWIAKVCPGDQAAEEARAVDPAAEVGRRPESDGSANHSTPASSKPRIRPWTNSQINAHRGDVAYARRLARSRKPACIERAVKLLRQLMRKHPFVLEPAYECVFALLELAQLETVDEDREKRWGEADRLLKRADEQFRGQMHHELRSRRGRLYKDQADHCLKNGEIERAQTLYKQAAKSYDEATKVSEQGKEYYPAVNAATCWWLARNAKAAKLGARKVLEYVKERERSLQEGDSEWMWVLATKGEAHVIAGIGGGTNWYNDASTAYQGALELAKKEGELKHQSSTMILQLERILKLTNDPPDKNNRGRLEELIQELKEIASQ